MPPSNLTSVFRNISSSDALPAAKIFFMSIETIRPSRMDWNGGLDDLTHLIGIIWRANYFIYSFFPFFFLSCMQRGENLRIIQRSWVRPCGKWRRVIVSGIVRPSECWSVSSRTWGVNEYERPKAISIFFEPTAKYEYGARILKQGPHWNRCSVYRVTSRVRVLWPYSHIL